MDLEKNTLSLGSRPGLIIVDMINGFTDPECPLGSDCPEVVAANKKLLDAARAKSLPIFFTTVIYRNEDQAKVFRQKIPALNVLQPDSHWVQIDPALERQDSETIIEKNWASSFFKTDLAEQLRDQQVDSVIVTGLTTSGCVRATAIDALQSDFVVFVPEQAVGDRNQDAHKANLFDISAKYGEVLDISNVLEHLDNL